MMEREGHVTVFLCLILTLIFSLLGVCLESARGAALLFRTRLMANSSLQSVFAGYDRGLWDRYRLLFCPAGDRSGHLLEQRLHEYAALQGPSGLETGLLWGTDWLYPEPAQAQVLGLVFATDQSGAVFERAVLEYMETGAGEILWEKMQEVLFGEAEAGEEDPLQAARDSAEKGEFNLEQLEEEYQNWEEAAQAALPEAVGAENGQGAGQEEDQGNGQEADRDTGQGAGAPVTAGGGETGRESLLPEGNLLEGLKLLLSHGVLGLVTEDPASLSAQTLGDGFLPSRMAASEREQAEAASSLDGAEGLQDTLLFQEYLLRFLDCYTSENAGEGMAYQLEYVVAGKETDRENLSAVIHRLLWVRAAMNLAYLASDAPSRSAAHTAAAALVGWTGIPALVAGLGGLLLAAWSYGEALVDVRSLLAGECVPLFKDRESWRLNLEGMASLTVEARTQEQKEEGLSYEDYLRLLLLTVGQEEKSYRTMDMIQRQMELLEPGFRLDQCVYFGEVLVQTESRLLFTPLFFWDRRQGWAGRHTLEVRASYGYETR